MSYILDALRKSDRERRLGGIPSLESSVLDVEPAPARRRWILWLIVVLIGINAATVGYLLWRTDTARRTVPSQAATETTPPPAERPSPARPPSSAPSLQSESDPVSVDPQPPKAPPAVAVSGPPAVEGAPTQAPVPDATAAKSGKTPVEPGANEPPQASIAELLAKRTETPESRKSPPAPASPRKPRPKTAQADPTPAKQVVPPVPAETKKPIPQPVTAAPAPEPAHPNAEDAIPYLDELPRDFRRRVPTFKINVYVSADNPEERFIIANMTKFRAGESVADGLTVEAIEPTHLILRFEGQRFRMKRP